MVTVAFLAFFTYIPNAKEALQNQSWLKFVCIVLVVTIFIMLSCPGLSPRRFPWNITCLVLLTLSLATVLTFLIPEDSSGITTLVALGMTILLTVLLTCIALTVSVDIKPYTMLGTLASIVFLVLTVVKIFMNSHILDFVVACSGMVTWSLFLFVGSYLILRGKYRYQFMGNKYIVAASCLYVEVILTIYYIYEVIKLLKNF